MTVVRRLPIEAPLLCHAPRCPFGSQPGSLLDPAHLGEELPIQLLGVPRDDWGADLEAVVRALDLRPRADEAFEGTAPRRPCSRCSRSQRL